MPMFTIPTLLISGGYRLTLTSKHKIHVMLKFSLTAGVPKVWRLMPDDPRWSWCNSKRNKVHKRCRLHRWLSGNESTNARRYGLEPWVRKMPWRRKWQLTPVFWPEESHGQRSLVGYSPWGHKQLDTTEHAHAGARNVMRLNHLENIPPTTPTPWKNCLPENSPWNQEVLGRLP